MFLVQQLYFLHNILPHLGKASSGLLPAPQHQAVFIVACADTIQRLPHSLQEKQGYSPFQMVSVETQRLKMATHDTAVFLIIHFFDLQAVRLKDTKCHQHRTERLWQSETHHNEAQPFEALPSYQIFKLHVQVLADGELCVWYGFVKVRVEIVEHLANRIKSEVVKEGTLCSLGPHLYSPV